jgi:hypothetical protein
MSSISLRRGVYARKRKTVKIITGCDYRCCESAHIDRIWLADRVAVRNERTLEDIMEFLLLWADNLDDALCALRHLAPKILGLLAAFVLFVVTGFALVVAPEATLAVLGVAMSASLIEGIRRRRASIANDR